MTTHAIITPWPLSQGIRTWCGYDAGTDEVRDDLVASSPAAVDCRQCIESMRRAFDNLGEWVPDLGGHDVEGSGLIIHVLDAGLPLCGFTRVLPGDWPDGHVWLGLVDYWENPASTATCTDCVSRAEALKAPLRQTSLATGDSVELTQDQIERMEAEGRISHTGSIEELAAQGAPLEAFPRIGRCGAQVDSSNFREAGDCGNPQYQTAGGPTCRDFHGGAPTLDKDPNA